MVSQQFMIIWLDSLLPPHSSSLFSVQAFQTTYERDNEQFIFPLSPHNVTFHSHSSSGDLSA